MPNVACAREYKILPELKSHIWKWLKWWHCSKSSCSHYVDTNIWYMNQMHNVVSGKGTMDMIFTVQHIQEKSYKLQRGLFQVFIDLTKAFNTVNIIYMEDLDIFRLSLSFCRYHAIISWWHGDMLMLVVYFQNPSR